MNHIYKVVWSKVKNCYVVVAEIARSNGKPHSQKVVAVLGTALISSMLFTGGEDSLRLQRQQKLGLRLSAVVSIMKMEPIFI